VATSVTRPVETPAAPAPASFLSGLPDELKPKRQWLPILQYGVIAIVLLLWVALTWIDSPFNSGTDYAATPKNKKPTAKEIAANNLDKDHVDLDENPVEGLLADENTANDTDSRLDIEPGKATGSGAAKPDLRGEVASIDSPAPDDLPEKAGDPVAANNAKNNAKGRAPELKSDDADDPTGVAVADKSGTVAEMPAKTPEKKSVASDKPAGKPSTEVAAVTPAARPETLPETPKTTPTPMPTPAPTPTPMPTARRGSPAVYVSQTGILLYENEEDAGHWHMRPRSSELEANLGLAVPEPFEAVLQIDGKRGIVRLCSETRIKTIESNEVGFGFEMHRGKVVLQSTPSVKEGAPLKVGIRLREESWILELGPDTTVGVFVTPRGASRFEQTFGNNWYEGTLFLKSGSVVVRSASGESTPMGGSGFWVMTPEFRASLPDKTPLLVPANKMPPWIDSKPLPRAAQLTAQRFEREFSLGSAVELRLGDVAKTANANDARLKVRCLGLVSSIQPLLEVLSNKGQHDESRQAAIDEIRMWLPSDPENGRELLKMLNVQFPPDVAKEYYRLLWGFDESDLATIAVTEDLLNWMESDDISIRELAFQNVRRYTPKEFEYRASRSATDRKTSMQSWRRFVRENGGVLIQPVKKPAKTPQDS
jgi:hypothetical protein